MKKKKWLVSFALLCCSVIFAVCGSVTLASGGVLKRLFGRGDQELFEEYYQYGETVSIPNHLVGGAESVTSTAVVEYPDGTQTGQKDVLLNQAGKYTVTYNAVSGGQVFTETYSFKVKYPTVTGVEHSTVYYGTSPYGDASDTYGLFVGLDGADTMVFSQIIDLRGSKKETFFVDLFPTPASVGSSDCEQFWITLTDVENAENYIEIRMNLYTEGSKQTMTLAARSNSQANVIGLESSTGFIHVGNQYGAYPGVEMNGMAHGVHERNGAINSLKLSYEESTKILWSHNKWGMPTKIVDFDDPQMVGDSLWNGFASGKVRMTFSAKGYMSEKANFVFKSVLGADFVSEGMDDTTAPKITVHESELAPAIGGEFAIPEYTVTDDYSPIVKKEVSVVKSGMSVLVKDGKFKTSSAGTYSIVYTAYDSFGNKAEETLYVVADVAESLTISDVILQATYNRGEKVLLPTADVLGGRGATSLRIYATVNGEKQLLKNNEFIPMQAASYTLTYEGVDEVGQTVSKDYTVSVVNGKNPVFRDEPALPEYFVSTISYRDPVLYAYDYASGTEKKVPATLTVSGPFGEQTVEQGGGFIPLIDVNFGETTLTWKAGESTLVRKVKTIFAFSGDGIFTENYFLGNAAVAKGDGFMEFTANNADDEWTFLNSLIADAFTMEFMALPKKSNFQAVDIVLADAENADVAFTVRLQPAENYRSTVQIGRRTALLSCGFDTYSNSNKFSLAYNDGVFSIGSAKIPVDKTDSGEDFSGFPSETVKITVKFVGAEKGAQYQVRNLCGQPLGELYSDRIKPLMKILGNYGGTSEVGASVTIPQMIARDVLNPTVITYVTAKDASGNFIKADDGTILNKAPTTKAYTFKTQTYGQYQCEYVARDTLSGRENKVPFIITVFDAEAPKISFATAPQNSAKVGEAIVVPNLNLSDNVSAKEDLIIACYIVSATGKIFYLPEGSNSMEATYAGTYQIRVLVYDAAGNIAMLRHDVTVTE